MFDVLVFTDATAKESLNGLSGFQFVARSAGAAAVDEEIVRTRLQHMVPRGPGAEDWRSHPHSCAYVVVSGRMYLGRGASIGAALDGRSGNQLTQAIITSDPYDVLPLRPAQLYSAPGWSLERPAGQEISAWTPPLEISPEFEVPALHHLVASDEWARAVLPAILTMIEQTQGDRRTRLMIRHPDQSLVMRWIALLSRFLDAQAALNLEFCVFATEPLRAVAHIVGVHPALSPDLTVQRTSGGVNLVDLEHESHTAITPTESAQRHARWFLIGDPYEALDAVEVSRRWAGAMQPDVAARAAELACLVSQRADATSENLRTSLAALSALAAGGHSDEIDAYGDALIDAIESYHPTESDDLSAVGETLWAVTAAGKSDLAQALALFALGWSKAQPPAATAWAHKHATDGRRLPWPDVEARARGASLLAGILSEASTDDLPALFALALSLDTGVSALNVAEAIDRLAEHWSSNPTLTSAARAWLHADIVGNRLRGRLAGLLKQGDRAATASLRDGAWDWLGTQPWVFQPDDPLSVWLATRALPGADAPTRRAMLAAVLAHAHSSAWELYLATPMGLDPNELVEWIRAQRAIDPTLADRIDQTIDKVTKHPAWQRGGAARVLHALGWEGVTGLTPALHARVTDQKRILNQFEQAKLAQNLVPNRALRELASSSGDSLTRIYVDWIVEAIVLSADIDGALALVRGEDKHVADRVAAVLEKQMRAGEVAALATALRLLDPHHRAWNSSSKRALDAVWNDWTGEVARQELVEGFNLSAEPPLQRSLAEYEGQRSKRLFSRAIDLVRGSSLFKSKRDQE